MRTPSFLFSGEKLLYQRRESSSYFLEIEGIFQLCPRKYFTHTKYIAWCCSTHIKSKDECSMLFIREERIRQAFITMMNKLNFGYSYVLTRSEERRVGKECRSGWWTEHEKKREGDLKGAWSTRRALPAVERARMYRPVCGAERRQDDGVM